MLLYINYSVVGISVKTEAGIFLQYVQYKVNAICDTEFTASNIIFQMFVFIDYLYVICFFKFLHQVIESDVFKTQ